MSSKNDNKKNTVGIDEIEAKSKRKITKLEVALKEKSKLEETYLNQLKYARADLENIQKNVQRRIDEEVTKEKENLIQQILTIAEELDIVLNEARKAKNHILLEGIEMIRKKFWKLISCEGLCPIEAIGKPFDPNLHDAVQEVETCDYPAGTIVAEIKKGYLLNGKVFRPCLVKVACSNPDSDKVRNGNES
jgi:molecular chaperone GrpE